MSTAQSTVASATAYKIDPVHSTVDFHVRHLMIANLRGDFSGVAGTVLFDPQNPANSKVEAEIEIASLHTRDANRDQHLKAAEFLDMEKFPKMHFVSKRVAAAGKDHWRVTGDLSLHGVTKEVTLDVEGPTPESKDPWGNVRVGASAKTKISRKEFGLTWNAPLETGGFVLGDEVAIHLEMELIKPKA
jgi:polyisoprenoid-binding protein YceI